MLSLLLLVNLVLAEECPSCGNLIESAAYNEEMSNGYISITKNPGNPCTQRITCSRLDKSPDGIVQISVNAFGHPQTVEFDMEMAILTVECDNRQGKYIMLGYPQFPLTNMIQCESTPGFGTPIPKTTTTTTKAQTPTTKTLTTPKTQCPNGGTWSSWSAATCNDTCGFCGVKMQTRQCSSSSSGCSCTGATVQYGARCGDSLCPFPRGSCCLEYAKRAAVGAKIKCVLL